MSADICFLQMYLLFANCCLTLKIRFLSDRSFWYEVIYVIVNQQS